MRSILQQGQQGRQMVLLKIGQTQLLLAQDQVRAVESLLDLQVQQAQPGSVGWVAFGGQRWPAFALDHELYLQTALAESSRACVLLQHGTAQRLLALVCDEVQVLAQFTAGLHALPDAMCVLQSPLQALSRMDGKLVCLTEAARLVKWIEALQEELGREEAPALDGVEVTAGSQIPVTGGRDA